MSGTPTTAAYIVNSDAASPLLAPPRQDANQDPPDPDTGTTHPEPDLHVVPECQYGAETRTRSEESCPLLGVPRHEVPNQEAIVPDLNVRDTLESNPVEDLPGMDTSAPHIEAERHGSDKGTDAAEAASQFGDTVAGPDEEAPDGVTNLDDENWIGVLGWQTRALFPSDRPHFNAGDELKGYTVSELAELHVTSCLSHLFAMFRAALSTALKKWVQGERAVTTYIRFLKDVFRVRGTLLPLTVNTMKGIVRLFTAARAFPDPSCVANAIRLSFRSASGQDPSDAFVARAQRLLDGNMKPLEAATPASDAQHYILAYWKYLREARNEPQCAPCMHCGIEQVRNRIRFYVYFESSASIPHKHVRLVELYVQGDTDPTVEENFCVQRTVYEGAHRAGMAVPRLFDSMRHFLNGTSFFSLELEHVVSACYAVGPADAPRLVFAQPPSLVTMKLLLAMLKFLHEQCIVMGVVTPRNLGYIQGSDGSLILVVYDFSAARWMPKRGQRVPNHCILDDYSLMFAYPHYRHMNCFSETADVYSACCTSLSVGLQRAPDVSKNAIVSPFDNHDVLVRIQQDIDAARGSDSHVVRVYHLLDHNFQWSDPVRPCGDTACVCHSSAVPRRIRRMTESNPTESVASTQHDVAAEALQCVENM